MLFRRIKSAAPNADVLAHRYWERVHRVGSLSFGVPPFEELGQQRKESLPEFGIDFVQPMIEAAFAEHLWHVAVLAQEAAGLVDVGTEEGRGYQGDGHNFGGCEPNLGIVKAVHSFQEVVAQAVDGGYGIVQVVLPVREGSVAFESGGYYLSTSIGGNLGY